MGKQRRPGLARARKSAGLSQERLAEVLRVDRSTVTRWECAETEPQPWLRPKLARALGLRHHELDDVLSVIELIEEPTDDVAPSDKRTALSVATSNDLKVAVWQGISSLSVGDEHEALELARRVAASDVSAETLSRLEGIVDELAVKYQKTPPQELLGPVRRHVSYVMRLLDARMTLEEHRRLLIVGGWLSLIMATLYVDVERRVAANSWLATAASLAKQTGQSEIHAWRYETEAWQTLINGDHRHAVELSQAAQRFAPRGSSAAIQATAQEGRAWARLRQAPETYSALNRVERFVSRMARPETPEHHYRYDPNKAEAYVATTLAWLGDAASEHHARHVVATFTHEAEAGRWPRRLASANIDLALALLLTDQIDEACAITQAAMLSGRLVASNHWRALEVVRTVEARGLPEASDLREAYVLMRQRSESG
ncbi:MAG: helix-turn-helix transcriptional regulator [Pseudonocardiaceae bacterium]